MSATFNEISSKLNSKNPLVITRKNINISNYYYIEKDFDNLNSYSLYICNLSNFPKDFSSDKILNFLIIVDTNIEYDLFKLENCNILMFKKDSINLYKLLEDLQDIINVKADIIASVNSIINTISQNETIDKIVTIMYDFFKNPIIIANAANYLCTYTSSEYKLNDTIWKKYIDDSYPDPEYLNNIYHDIKFLKSISKENEPHIIDYLDIMEHRIILCPVTVNNLNMAYIYILESNIPFNKEHLELLNTLKKILIPAILNDPRFSFCNDIQLDSIFFYLLSSDNIKSYYLEKSCEILNLDLNSYFFLITIDPCEQNLSNTSLKNLYTLIKDLFFNQFVFIYEGKICILCFCQNTKRIKKEKIESKQLLNLCQNYNLIACVSDVFYKLNNVKFAYEQTLKCLYFKSNLDSSKRVFYYSDFMLTNLVYSFLLNKDTNNIIDLNFMEFLKCDNEEYLETVKSFVKHNGNIKNTAENLHIHYNTLKYRLNKIGNLYSMDLDDLNYVIKLKLYYIALDFISN